jgi:hypothetical protein
MNVSAGAVAVGTACAVCCAPLIIGVAAMVPPLIAVGAAATAAGLGLAGLTGQRGRAGDRHESGRPSEPRIR